MRSKINMNQPIQTARLGEIMLPAHSRWEFQGEDYLGSRHTHIPPERQRDIDICLNCPLPHCHVEEKCCPLKKRL